MMFIGEGLTMKLVIGGSFILIGNLFAQLEHFHVLRFIKKGCSRKSHSLKKQSDPQ
ncbi:hypothetical protein OL548_17015 [Lysinibacillus sp. MHQ-1]|nr:hypothetical protein OL548_17015 [Lysinibacillus sp. MHQ-1]